MTEYKPNPELLEKYAEVMINFALGSGKGIKEKQIIYFTFDTTAMPLAKEIYKKILQKDAYPMYKMVDEDFTEIKFDLAKDHQLEFFPDDYYKTLVDTMDHRIALIGERNPLLLQDVDPKKITMANKYRKKLRKWLNKKEDEGKYTWTLCLYGTQGMADQAGLSLEEYWQQIEKACYLDKNNPTKEWQRVFKQIEDIREKLNAMDIEKLHLVADNTDLWIKLGDKRVWNGGSGRNIPSFEIFTSPDWRGTNGKISFDLPLYRYGNIVKDIYLEFKDGKVTKVQAGDNENLIKEVVSQENADKIGEFSLTDRKFSRIDKFMAKTLYDENFGGEYGNTHIALGSSYHDTYDGDPQEMAEKDWEELGFNESPEHVDIMATTKREVTAVLKGGKEKIIYKDGEFTI